MLSPQAVPERCRIYVPALPSRQREQQVAETATLAQSPDHWCPHPLVVLAAVEADRI
jgi:hypothetical protein